MTQSTPRIAKSLAIIPKYQFSVDRYVFYALLSHQNIIWSNTYSMRQQDFCLNLKWQPMTLSGSNLELYKVFAEEAYSIALHPSGLYILVGFSDKLRLMNLLIDDIRTFKEFTVRGCKEVWDSFLFSLSFLRFWCIHLYFLPSPLSVNEDSSKLWSSFLFEVHAVMSMIMWVKQIHGKWAWWGAIFIPLK